MKLLLCSFVIFLTIPAEPSGEYGEWNGKDDRFVTLAEFEAGETARRRGKLPERPAADDVLILVMASRSLQDRVTLLEHSWSDVPLQRFFLVDDWLDTAPREKQWRPSSAEAGSGQSGGGFDGMSSNYWDAQSRQLEFMRSNPKLSEIQGTRKVPRWILLSDDDTYVNVEMMLEFLSGHDPEVPALFGYILGDAHVLGYDYPCGGAGMLLSSAAYELLAPRLLGPDCPLLAFNDLTIGFCAHSRGIPLVHHPGMHCAPDVNRAMRPGENLLDIQKSIAVHRLIAFASFEDMIGTLDRLKAQISALLQRRCLLAASLGDESKEFNPFDSRRFFWNVHAFADAVSACRLHAPRPASRGPLHVEFLLFGGGLPVAHYHQDRGVPLVAEPASRAARWPDWMGQLQHLSCAESPAVHHESELEIIPELETREDILHERDMKGQESVTWAAHWLSVPPRLSRRQVEATGAQAFADTADLNAETVSSSFEKLEQAAPRGSWLAELKRAARSLLSEGDTLKLQNKSHKKRPGPGRRWLFLDFAPSTTFVNMFESVRLLRSLSGLYQESFGDSEANNPYLADVRSPVDLGAEAPPPLGMAYEYFDMNVEQAAGVWINGVAAQRMLRCNPLHHPIALDPDSHANDWPTREARTALLWHNAIAVDVFRTLRFCGVILLHAPTMVPHALSYLPYSTYRRSHAPSVASSLTVGNVASREQMKAMSELVTRRACAAQRSHAAACAGHSRSSRGKSRRGGDRLSAVECQRLQRSQKSPLRMRILGGDVPLNLTAENWQLAGARYFGLSLVAFRSEHFLPDAQAAGMASTPQGKPRIL